MKTLMIGYQTISNNYCLIDIDSEFAGLLEEKLNNTELSFAGQKIIIEYKWPYIPDGIYHILLSKFENTITELNEGNSLSRIVIELLDNNINNLIKNCLTLKCQAQEKVR